MIEIPEPPRQTECTACWRPITWMWSYRHKAWVGLVLDVHDQTAARVHRCPPSDALPSWREGPNPFTAPDPTVAERAHRGAAMAAQALAAAKQRNPEDQP